MRFKRHRERLIPHPSPPLKGEGTNSSPLKGEETDLAPRSAIFTPPPSRAATFALPPSRGRLGGGIPHQLKSMTSTQPENAASQTPNRGQFYAAAQYIDAQ